MVALDSFIVKEEAGLSLLHVISMKSKARMTCLFGSFDWLKARQ